MWIITWIIGAEPMCRLVQIGKRQSFGTAPSIPCIMMRCTRNRILLLVSQSLQLAMLICSSIPDLYTYIVLLHREHRYLDLYLEGFLMSADKHFMPGFSVIYYVFVDDLLKLKGLRLSGRRKVKSFKVEKHKRWQDISMFRMKTISKLIDDHIRHEANYVFCFDVDQRFEGRFGTETLSESVALLHAWFYRRPKFLYSYDLNPHSAAYMGTTAGDFYYHAAVFGGTWQCVKNLTETCHRGIMQDKQNNVEALWHDESHLNKYFWLHKPTKVLSPEYCWDRKIGWRRDIHVFRMMWAAKQYDLSRQIE
ncbi:N-acetyllactosaminide alpha-1,3-galactosyltransferase-like isoform X7 [Heterodontus francisci]|uniref:N-acetyllactosaminide alpha-1,3-galactosyltransferase-like isoform X7 n=1 Tax=Heterodontus francisci TaxID=7792 RepID=UPI00355C3834